MDVLGIDVGKEFFHCELLCHKPAAKKFQNTLKGFEQLAAWLRNRKAARVHACMEATGGWSEELGAFLYERGHVVSIVNAMQIRAFGKSELSRTKTDKADAALIARFCQTMKPAPWEPPTPQQRRLRQLVRRRRALVVTRTRENNRLGAPGTESVQDSISQSIAFLDKQIADLDAQIQDVIKSDPDLRAKCELIQSIKGFGEKAASTILAEGPNLDAFHSAKALTAYAGLCPQQRHSGSSVSSSHLTRIGNHNIRGIMYMVALSGMRFNTTIQNFATRLRERAKRPMQILVAVMRKMLVLAYGVVRSHRPFEAAA